MRNHYVIDWENDVVRITLNRQKGDNLITIVDRHNLQRLLRFDVKWTAKWSKDMASFYAVAYFMDEHGKRQSVMLHRWLMECGDERIVHGRNGTLDNREENMRIVSKNTTWLGAGVHYDSSRGKFFIVGKSYPKAKNKRPQRYFDTKEQAEHAYQQWCDYWKDYTFI